MAETVSSQKSFAVIVMTASAFRITRLVRPFLPFTISECPDPKKGVTARGKKGVLRTRARSDPVTPGEGVIPSGRAPNGVAPLRQQLSRARSPDLGGW